MTQHLLDPGLSQISNLGELSREAAHAFPSRVAIKSIVDGQETELTYAELEGRIQAIHGFLESTQLRVQDRVAIALGNGHQYIETVLAVLRFGAVPVLLNTRLDLEALDHIIRDAGCRAVFCDPLTGGALANIADELGLSVKVLIGGERSGWAGYDQVLAHAVPKGPIYQPGPSDVALQPYTSGSTGRPKGVLLGHQGQIWFSKMHAAYMRQVSPGDDPAGLLVVPMFHKNAWVGLIKPMLLVGGRMVIVGKFDAREALGLIASERLTYMSGVAALYDTMMQQIDLLDTLDFSSFTAFFCGAAPAHKELLVGVENRLGARAYHVYGLTEGGPGVLTHPADQPRGPLESCGKLNSLEAQAKLVGPDGQESASFGELWVSNPGMALGYHNLPQLTAQRFEGGWLRTGDLMSRDAEGWFYFEGRTDDMINCGGENIYPMEVERVLSQHPAVSLACVVPVSHETKGAAPAAMISLRAGKTATSEELKAFYLERAPAFSHPREVLIVDDLPRASTDKIDKRQVIAAIEAAVAAKRTREIPA